MIWEKKRDQEISVCFPATKITRHIKSVLGQEYIIYIPVVHYFTTIKVQSTL